MYLHHQDIVNATVKPDDKDTKEAPPENPELPHKSHRTITLNNYNNNV